MENAYVYGLFIGMIVLFFPVFLSLDAYADIAQNKAFFSVHLFKFFKLTGGYITLQKEGIAVHISDKKAIFVPFADMQNERKKFEITSGFQLYTLRTSLEVGDGYFPMLGFYTAAFTQILSQTVYPWLCHHKKFMNLKNGTLLLHGDDTVKATVHVVTVFNQLTIGIALAKLILEAIINLWQKKKNTKQLKA